MKVNVKLNDKNIDVIRMILLKCVFKFDNRLWLICCYISMTYKFRIKTHAGSAALSLCRNEIQVGNLLSNFGTKRFSNMP